MPRLSLWMMPPPAVRARFHALIAELSRRVGTPPFEPHLTLSGIDAATETAAIRPIAALAARLPPLAIRLTDVGTTPAYFRCVFVRAEHTPVLDRAYHAARRALGQAPGEFMPHLSLIYGELTPATKERLIAEIGNRFDTTFIVERLALYDTAGPPPTWRCIADFRLSRLLKN